VETHADSVTSSASRRLPATREGSGKALSLPSPSVRPPARRHEATYPRREMSTATDNPIRNGVDTATLFATLDAVKANNNTARSRSRPGKRWARGPDSQGPITGFYGAGREMQPQSVHVSDVDPPAVLVGTDIGPTPVEYVLPALAACLTAGIANIAAARNIK